MDVIPLPPRPNLEQYRKRAKDLVKAWQSTRPDALEEWASNWLHAVLRLLPDVPTDFVRESLDRAIAQLTADLIARRPEDKTGMLAEAQLVMARAHGFASWELFSRHVQELHIHHSPHSVFERAADAVITGDVVTLRALLTAQPTLVRDHSARSHAATLLHYVAANGVEDFRQKSPKNAVEVATLLLDAGAEADAIADTYGKDRYQTTMNLLVSSVHPAAAGVQVPLVHLLADRGAAVNGLDDDSSPLITAIAFGYVDAAGALAERGARIDQVATAAAMGRLDLVQTMVVDRDTLAPHTPTHLVWIRIPASPRVHIEFGAVWATRYGHFNVVDWLLDIGVDPKSMDQRRMSLLHWAAARGGLATVDRLVAAGADLERTNTWGGTVLSSTLHFAQYDPYPGVDYLAVTRHLLALGADPRAVGALPPRLATINTLLASASHTA